MDKIGEFGTDTEMRAAVELFNVAVFCFAPYCGNNFVVVVIKIENCLVEKEYVRNKHSAKFV